MVASKETQSVIEFTNFILCNKDMKNPRAVLAMMVNFTRAFNRQNHNKLIPILSELGAPAWLLTVVMAF